MALCHVVKVRNLLWGSPRGPAVVPDTHWASGRRLNSGLSQGKAQPPVRSSFAMLTVSTKHFPPDRQSTVFTVCATGRPIWSY